MKSLTTSIPVPFSVYVLDPCRRFSKPDQDSRRAVLAEQRLGRRNLFKPRGITYCGTDLRLSPLAGTHLTAETAWALIFALAKRVVVEDGAMRTGHWRLAFPTTLAGTTLG
jgi:hypothetical protein